MSNNGRRASSKLKLFSSKSKGAESAPKSRYPDTASREDTQYYPPQPAPMPNPVPPQAPAARPMPSPVPPDSAPQPRAIPNPAHPTRTAPIAPRPPQSIPVTSGYGAQATSAYRYTEQPEHYSRIREAEDASQQRVLKSKRFRRKYTIFSSVCVALVTALYAWIAFFSTGPLGSLRTIYIETALMTFSHSWMATAIFPSSVVDVTRDAISAFEKEQSGLVSVWDDVHNSGDEGIVIEGDEAGKPDGETDTPDTSEPAIPYWQDAGSSFYTLFDELDPDTLISYISAHPDQCFDDNGQIFIDKADIGEDATGILTRQGDPVVAIDERDGILLARVSGGSFLSGNNYQGVIAFIKDASAVELATSSRFGSVGEKIGIIAGDNGAILGINASGFADDGGSGNGGTVHGLVVVNGETLHRAAGGSYFTIYFDSNDHLNVSAYYDGLDIVHGVEFKPAIIVNGENKIANESFGIQPRTSIAQKADGTVMMLVVDGRQASYSLGTTVTELEVIFERYDALQAACLDGGSSSVMYFNERLITSSSSPQQGGRYLPDAFLVMPKVGQ